ncbi:acyl-CoA N-acyltransferase [Macrolepiota fuliginosa MF-IS2]|uniref:Acyl-CoA N-acyltransferase n=1 Tax=Macrolepiota fuliginosa MF-IS2 TaxID=1400762 RepID=A0A9P5X7U1_9AGAR|nr:acyl-CoA N-acyltransferase [Macrolepiota fuliginosa MF-IS2]
MSNRLGPLETNPSTKEPFLRLRGHPNVVITPPRQTDIPHMLPPMNDERIHIWLSSTPYPYTLEHAQNWLNRITPECELGLKELREALENNEPIALTHSPVRCLRELQEDGSDIFLGDIGLIRCPDIPLENSKHDNATNRALPVGHPEIIWTIGDYLVASHHRRGIMTDAVDTLVNNLGKPLLGARHFVAAAYSGNEGSQKVFLKNGFTQARCIRNFAEVKGFMRDLCVFERYDRDETS